MDTNYTGVLAGTGPTVTKTGSNTLTLSGSTSNTFSGTTVVAGGTLVLAKTNGAVAIAGNVLMTDMPGGGSSFLVLGGDNEIYVTKTVSFNNPNAWGHFDLNGHSQTLAGISDTDSWGVIEGRWDNTGVDTDSVLTIYSVSSSSFNGTIRDKCQGSGAGRLKLVKMGNYTLTLLGANTGFYTGGLTVSGGTLDYSGGALPDCDYIITNGTLNIGTLSQSIGYFRITGGTVAGTGALTSNVAYNVQGGTVNAVLAGMVGLNKITASSATVNAPTYTGTTNVSAGTLNFTGGLPGGNYAISGGTLNIGAYPIQLEASKSPAAQSPARES